MPDHQEVPPRGRDEIQMPVVVEVGESDRVDLVLQPNHPIKHAGDVDGDLSLSAVGTYVNGASGDRVADLRGRGEGGVPDRQAGESQPDEMDRPHAHQDIPARPTRSKAHLGRILASESPVGVPER